MEYTNHGGRPPDFKIKLILQNLMKKLTAADVNLVRQRFIEGTGQSVSYYTVKKYLDMLTDEDFLRAQVVQDNIQKVEKGLSKQRRRIFFYEINS